MRTRTLKHISVSDFAYNVTTSNLMFLGKLCGKYNNLKLTIDIPRFNNSDYNRAALEVLNGSNKLQH